MTTSLTQQFATEYAKRAVPGMLKAIRLIRLANKGIVVGAVAASYLHQAHFLQTLGAGIFSWIVPAVFDLAIVSMLTITQTVGMATDAKRAALKVLVVVVLISAAVNAAAPGPIGLRIIFALVVGLVAAVEWVAGKIRPDFTAIENRENELTTNNPPVADTTTVDSPAAVTTPVLAAQPAEPDQPPAQDIPTRLVSAARMITMQHRQMSTEPITADELATRLNTTPVIAGRLLTTIDNPDPTRINGNASALGGTR